MKRHTQKARRGFALLEAMVCIGITGLLVSLGGVCFADMIRLRGAQSRYSARRQTAEHLLRRFADDVRSGRAFLMSHGPYTAGARTLIIAREHGVIIYHAAESVVTRIDNTPGALPEQHVAVGAGADVHFANEAGARSAVMTIAWREPPKIGISQPVLSLRTTLRNRTHGYN